MNSVLRSSLALAIALVCLSTAASADVKIKTRTTVMGHSSEGTVYIKGARERNDMNFGGHGAATIIQCDQKRMITVSGDRCMVMPMGGEEASCPAVPSPGARGRNLDETEPTASRKGGVVTITRTSTDTGERQEMLGYKARHIKTSMTMESSPDACNQSNMKMETDGWYADLSAGFSCGDESYRSLACGTGRRGERCHDRIMVKGGGSASLGYPLKQTTTVTSAQGTFTNTTEVLEVTTATLDAPLFEMPPGCKVTDMSAMLSGSATATQPGSAPEQPSPAPKAEAAAAAQPPAPPAPTVAPKAAGVVRIGVVKVKDLSGQSLPTDSLRLNLLSEIGRHQLEAVPLDAEAPPQDVEREARAKECDYILYTMPSQVKDPGTGGLPPALVPKGVVLDPAKFEALTTTTLYKTGKPLPEIKDLPLAADAGQFAVNAVMVTFVMASDKVAHQVDEDAHPKAPSKSKPSAKPAATRAKPN